MPYSIEERHNLDIVTRALEDSARDFTRFFETTFATDVVWTIAGHGPVAGTYHGMADLFERAEKALFSRLSVPLAITTHGIWADGDEVFARIKSASIATDGAPYGNEYLYIMTMKDGKVASGIEWLDLHAYYGIVERVKI